MAIVDSQSESVVMKVVEPISIKMWTVALIVALPSFLFGYILAALNACLLTGDADSQSKCYFDNDDASPDCPIGTVFNDIRLSTFEVQMATALAVAGAWIGSLLGSTPSQKYGRRLTLIINNIFFLAGAVMCSMPNKWVLFVGRFVAGCGVGVESVVAPVLLSEVASPEHRGTITTLHQFMITAGVFIAALVGYGFVQFVPHGWIFVQALIAVPSVINLLGMQTVPESPKWLVAQDRIQEARAAVATLRPEGHDVDKEMDMIIQEVNLSPHEEATWEEVFACTHAVIIGCGLMFASAVTGINTVIFYSATIFGFAGFEDAVLAAAAVGGINVLSTALATYLVDVLGRRELLLYGTKIMMVALSLLGVVLLTLNDSEKVQGIIAVIAVLVYVVGFAVGLGAVSWVVMSEVMTTHLRSKAFGMFVSINWGTNLIIGLFTLTAIDGMGGTETDVDDDDEISRSRKRGVALMYIMFAGICLATLVFIYFFVPETKGKNPDDLMTEKERDLLGRSKSHDRSVSKDGVSNPLRTAHTGDAEHIEKGPAKSAETCHNTL